MGAITGPRFMPHPLPDRDGPDQSAPQLGVFSGNTALESAYSSTSQVLLRFHSDFSNGGFFVLNFHGQCPHPVLMHPSVTPRPRC